MRRHLAPIALVLAVFVVLAGCGDDDDVATEDTATTAPAEDPIAGRTFEAVDLEGGAHTLAAGATLTIAFTEEGSITVDAGCNRLSGTYSLDGPILVVRDLAGTEMGCDPALMEQDAWIAGLLSGRPTITPTPPDGLVLSRGEAESENEVLTMVEPGTEEAADLVGPTWTVDTLIDDEAASSVPPGVTATVSFAADGTYQVSAGCNTGSGTYAEAGAGIYQIDAPALTRRRCDDDAMAVEAAVTATLDGEVTVTIEDDRLTLTADGGSGISLAAG